LRIGFTGALAPDRARLGESTLRAHPETFAADTRHFRPDRSKQQWRQALKMALVQRDVAVL